MSALEVPASAKLLAKRGRIACIRCRSMKIKCSGETPCRNCRLSVGHPECTYRIRDRKVKVSERYLRNLEAEIATLKQNASSSEIARISADPSPADESAYESESGAQVDSGVANPLFDETVGFVDDGDVSRRTYVGEAATATFETRVRQMIRSDQSSTEPQGSLYFNDRSLLRVTSSQYQLPSRTYAKLLVKTLLQFVGSNYHLMTEKSFLKKLDETYAGEHLEPHWLARVFAIFALGELYLNKTSTINNDAKVPGTQFFLQAMALFPDLYEEVDLAYIETLIAMSLYSNALNRARSAHALSALAVRLSLTLGLHRNDLHDSRLPVAERERRHRIWWTVYNVDRVGCLKMGQPALLRDEDIDAPLPSLIALTDAERAEFVEPEGLIAKTKLSEIIGLILDLIYRTPRARQKDHFVQNVHQILARLRNWNENLPAHLKLDRSASPPYASRSVASLHLQFDDCIIVTTRPVLLHVFKTELRARDQVEGGLERQPHSEMTATLSEACIQASRNSLQLLSQMWIHGSVATYGDYNSNCVFASAIVLLISNLLHENQEDQELLETAWDLLQMMINQGNAQAAQFLERLVRLKSNMDDLKSESNGPTNSQNDPNTSHLNGTVDSTRSADESFGTIPPFSSAALDDPKLQEFLMQPGTQWSPDIFSSTEELPYPWMYDMDPTNALDADFGSFES